jgi:phenylalanyl-tRNA synthetase beta chain
LKISLSWLREFVDLPEPTSELVAILDDLGLVVEGIQHVGEGLEDVVVARIDEIRTIEGADRVRLVVVDAGSGPLEIVCGATNFVVGNYVPLAPVGAVLPGGFEIAQRKMRGVTSNGMLCSARELALSDDHVGLMILDDLMTPHVGASLMQALGIVSDVVFDISIEGNRPDAWCVEGVARDLAVRLGRALRSPFLATTQATMTTKSLASAFIDAPDLCGRLTVSVLRNVRVGPSPAWIAQRLTNAGMRPISNVVDASNFVMLELGQPTHPYDADLVANKTLRVRAAVSGEVLTTLDGVERKLAMPGRGLGDTGVDCVIVDGADSVLGLAGIMGGATSEISDNTSEVLLEAAFFDPMTVARSSKRHGLRSEASNRFERGVDPSLALRAAARFVAILSESVPELEWLADPLDVSGEMPVFPEVELRVSDIERVLGVAISYDDVVRILKGLNFSVTSKDDVMMVQVPSARLDIRAGSFGRADIIEEVARLYSYQRLARHVPSWPEPGALSDRQVLRRKIRNVLVDAGVHEAWTPTLGSDDDFELSSPGSERVRITNPLAADESVLRATIVTGLVRAWAKNAERGLGDVMVSEMGTVFTFDETNGEFRESKGGSGGATRLRLPLESERCTVLLAREGDDATSAIALWSLLSSRLNLDDVVARSTTDVAPMYHPTRCAMLQARHSGAVLGYVGEIDPSFAKALAPGIGERRLGVLDISLDVLADETLVPLRSPFATMPSRFPSAVFDLAFVTPRALHAQDLGYALRHASALVEDVRLFDVYDDSSLPAGTRSLAYAIRISSSEATLSEGEVAHVRSELIATASELGANLR